LFPRQLSTQNLEYRMFPTLKEPIKMKLSLSFIRPFQNGKSFGLTLTYERVCECKYLLCNNSSHTPSLFKSLYNHLLSNHFYLISRTFTTKPPLIFRSANYVPLSQSILSSVAITLPKKSWSKKSNLLHSQSGISRKDIVNMDKLVRTELIRTTLRCR
jgi:hypothetical protein